MQLVQTAADPPNQGRMSLAMSGCTWKSRNALRRIVAAKSSAGTRGLLVCGDAGDSLADDEGVDVVGAFIRFDGFEIAQMSHYRIFVRDAVGSEEVAAQTGAFEGHGGVVALQHGNVGRVEFAGVLEASAVQGEKLGLGDLGDH